MWTKSGKIRAFYKRSKKNLEAKYKALVLILRHSLQYQIYLCKLEAFVGCTSWRQWIVIFDICIRTANPESSMEAVLLIFIEHFT